MAVTKNRRDSFEYHTIRENEKHLSDADTGPFTLNEFSFYMKEDDRYIHIPVFELKLSAQTCDIQLRFENISASKLDDLESINAVELEIEPTDYQWERLRYYVYDQENQMSFYCGGWDVIKCDKKSH